MTETGELTEWYDDRGFGFVRAARGDLIYVHIKTFGPLLRRPRLGDSITFERGPSSYRRRPAALSASITGLAAPPPPAFGRSSDPVQNAQRSRALRLAVAAMLLAVLLFIRSTGHLPNWVLWIYLVMSIVSAIAYWIDKRAALAKRIRVSEVTLHTLDLAFGLIGGLLAQVALRHKTAKPSFVIVTWAIVILHAVALLLIWLGVPEALLKGIR